MGGGGGATDPKHRPHIKVGKDAAFAAAADGNDDDVDEEIAALLLVCTMWAYYCLSKCIHAYATTI